METTWIKFKYSSPKGRGRFKAKSANSGSGYGKRKPYTSRRGKVHKVPLQEQQ